MKIKVCIAIEDLGDGSHAARAFRNREEATEVMELDEEGFGPYDDVPVEFDEVVIDVSLFERVD